MGPFFFAPPNSGGDAANLQKMHGSRSNPAFVPGHLADDSRLKSLRPILLPGRALEGHCLGSDPKASLIPSSGAFLFPGIA